MPEPSSPCSSDKGDSLRELAGLAAGGDNQAFERIHRRLAGGLTRFFLTRNGGRADLAEELAQKTWVEVWRAIRRQRYDPQRGAVSTFIYAVAYKLWLQHCRTSRTGLQAQGVRDYLTSLIEDSARPDDVLFAADLLDALRACLSGREPPHGLSEDERLLVFRSAAGSSERTLASEFGVAASTINGRKRLIYNKLRKCLAAKGFRADHAERGTATDG